MFGGVTLLPPEQDSVKRIEAEIADVDAQIRELQSLKDSLRNEKRQIITTAQSREAGPSGIASSSKNGSSTAKSSNALSHGAIDFTKSDFPWSGELLVRAKQRWGIEKWRMCQEGVVNAVLEGRDVICIMPTGGGKSLCYQLPAIMSVGITLVISPLISLSTDQCFHLQEAGIPCEFMSSSLSREDANDILRRVRTAGTPSQSSQDEIRILFVTPERIAKSKSLLAALQKAYERGRLARIVIDEAHCCSAQGHDFRPDYRKLSIMRKLFPETKTTCLTATCSPTCLRDVIHILGMPDTTEPTCAWPNRTVYFTAPLHRPNLIYKVMTRPSSAQASAQMICDWILEHHPNETGIVYCLSKKDTETMAAQLNELSQGRIKTGCYHADVDDDQKHRIHVRWREGKVRVVCATIAFGMGIDKPDVRFVLHSGISKSLEGYYQESGRAGRDGNRSDCVLFYRPQDASRLASLVAGEHTGREKLTAMLEYAQSSRCRKLIFSDYFQDSHSTKATSAQEMKCGQCDNCISPPDSIDVSLESWQVVNAMDDMYSQGARITVANLADLVRGLKNGAYTINSNSGGKKGKGRRDSSSSSTPGTLDMSQYGGKITTLNSDEVERMIISLLNLGFLGEDYNATAYSVNVYVSPGPKAIRYTRVNSWQEAQKNFTNSGAVRIIGSSKKSKSNSTSSKETPKKKTQTKVKESSSNGNGKGAASKRGSKQTGKKAATSAQDFIDDDIDDAELDGHDASDERRDDFIIDNDEYEEAIRAEELHYSNAVQSDPPSSAYYQDDQDDDQITPQPKRKRQIVEDDSDDGVGGVKSIRPRSSGAGIKDEPIEID
ncbi:unnamed protein product [Sympodiomycopsis kandeliae]